MIHELPKSRFQLVSHLFSTGLKNPVVFGVIEGNNPGKIFVDNMQNPKCALVWAQTEEDFYLVCERTNSDFITALNSFIIEKLPKLAEQADETSFNLFFVNQELEENLNLIFKDLHYFSHKILHYELDDQKYKKNAKWRDYVSKDIKLVAIDENLFSKVRDDGDTPFQEWWHSFKIFKKNGLGYAVLVDDTIASTCFACFVGDNAVEIGIVTLPEHMRKGYGYLTAMAFLEECNKRVLTPIWHTGIENTPSQKLAEKIGFELVARRTCYYRHYDEFSNLYEQAYLFQKNKQYKKALEKYEQAIKIGNPSRYFYYNYATTLSLLNHIDEAFEKLYLFIDNVPAKMLKHKDELFNNTNLKALQSDSRWSQLLESLRRKAP